MVRLTSYLSEIIVKEQYFNTCSKELVNFLKERMGFMLEELAKVAEHYSHAHQGNLTENTNTK